jgi:hypothetical protein
MPEQGDLPQSSPGEYNLIKDPGDTLDGHWFPTQAVLNGDD